MTQIYIIISFSNGVLLINRIVVENSFHEIFKLFEEKLFIKFVDRILIQEQFYFHY